MKKNIIAYGPIVFFLMISFCIGCLSNKTSQSSDDSINTPSNLTASSTSPNQVNLSWEDTSTNKNGFIIERSHQDANSYSEVARVASDSTGYTDSGLTADTVYYYRVKAYNESIESSYSNEVSVTTATDGINAPINLTAAVTSETEIYLTWSDQSDNETGFIIEKSPGSANNFSIIATITTSDTESYSDTGLTSGITYYYRVQAYNNTSKSLYSNTANATTTSEPQTQIIADHTIVDDYDKIPQKYIDIVKTWLVDIAGESHSAAYRDGMVLLETENLKFQVITFNRSMNSVTKDQGLRFGSHDWVGEEDFWTNEPARTKIESIISTYESNGNPIHVIGQGWCWDFDRNPVTEGKDLVYHCGWAGSTAGGPDGDRPWGLDSGDSSITGNSVCCDTYLETIDRYNQYCSDHGYICKAIFTTGPVDTNHANEKGYQRYIKHEYIRNHVKKNSSRILFDYADILCHDGTDYRIGIWDDDGTERRYHTGVDSLTAAPQEQETGHISKKGAIILAKAMWWMLARIAGWDGVSTDL